MNVFDDVYKCIWTQPCIYNQASVLCPNTKEGVNAEKSAILKNWVYLKSSSNFEVSSRAIKAPATYEPFTLHKIRGHTSSSFTSIFFIMYMTVLIFMCVDYHWSQWISSFLYFATCREFKDNFSTKIGIIIFDFFSEFFSSVSIFIFKNISVFVIFFSTSLPQKVSDFLPLFCSHKFVATPLTIKNARPVCWLDEQRKVVSITVNI